MVLKYGLLVLAYLIGSIPISVVLGKVFKGVDIRKHGSGNPGGTNTLRFLGKPLGILTISFDILKGSWIIILAQVGVLDESLLLPIVIYGIAGILGHVFSIFLKFKGGKAVASSAGLVAAINPWMALVILIMFITALKTTKLVSVASSTAAVGFVLVTIAFADWGLLPYALFLCALVLYRHKSNFANIKNKVEPKITWL